MELFRITDSLFANTLLPSGKPARWNSKDIEMLYLAQSFSLACLENAVHRTKIELKNINFSKVIVQAPNDFEVATEKELPHGWNEITLSAILLCRNFGDDWIRRNSSLLLRVPSVIIPGEYNFLVNVKHPDFKKLKIVEVSPFLFDDRIK
jgi:RES domain-containing protein